MRQLIRGRFPPSLDFATRAAACHELASCTNSEDPSPGTALADVERAAWALVNSPTLRQWAAALSRAVDDRVTAVELRESDEWLFTIVLPSDVECIGPHERISAHFENARRRLQRDRREGRQPYPARYVLALVRRQLDASAVDDSHVLRSASV